MGSLTPPLQLIINQKNRWEYCEYWEYVLQIVFYRIDKRLYYRIILLACVFNTIALLPYFYRGAFVVWDFSPLNSCSLFSVVTGFIGSFVVLTKQEDFKGNMNLGR